MKRFESLALPTSDDLLKPHKLMLCTYLFQRWSTPVQIKKRKVPVGDTGRFNYNEDWNVSSLSYGGM